jgi:protease I
LADLKGKRAAILVEELYQELEVWYPLYRLREAGATVVTVGTGKPEYKSKLGYPVAAEADARELRGRDFDAVVIPGGFAPDFMRRHESVPKFVADAAAAGRVIAAICHGLWICASAGILKGKRATGFFAIKDDIVNAGAAYVDQEVCVDGRLVTSRKPDDLPAFMRETMRLMGG